MTKRSTYRVGEAAKIAKTTVRTLHHYDSIGLLRPSLRAPGEYREYTEEDLQRLFLVRMYRELRMPLAEIKVALDEGGGDFGEALRAHRERLSRDLHTTQALLASVDRLLQREDTAPMAESFNDFKFEEYAEEAEERWGETSAWSTSATRLARYTEVELAKARSEHAEGLQLFAEALRAGATPESPRAVQLAEQARRHIDHWYYPLTREAHVTLAQMYVDDPRFKRTYEEVAPGLALYVKAAIEANAERDRGTEPCPGEGSGGDSGGGPDEGPARPLS